MSPNGGKSAESAANRSDQRRDPDIADAALRAAITPGPTAAFVEEGEGRAGFQPTDLFTILLTVERGGMLHFARHFGGVVRGNDDAGEADIGKVTAIGVRGGIEQGARSGQRKFTINGRRLARADGRRRRWGYVLLR